MALRGYFGALWVEFSKVFVEDCRFYFMPWMRMKRESNSYKNR